MPLASRFRRPLAPRVVLLFITVALTLDLTPGFAALADLARSVRWCTTGLAAAVARSANVGIHRAGVLHYVELVEYFCEEHHVPWPVVAKVSTCAGKWDERPLIGKLQLRAAKTWITMGTTTVDDGAPSIVLTESWRLDSLRNNERCLLWFALLWWRSGLLLRIQVNDAFQRILRVASPDADPGFLWVQPVNFRGAPGVPAAIGKPYPVLRFDDRWNGHRSYVGAWLPRRLLEAREKTTIRLQLLDLPLSPTQSAQSQLKDRVVTFVHSP